MEQYWEFEDAREFVQSLGFQNVAEFRLWIGGQLKEDLPSFPKGIPQNPHQVYQNEGFISMSDFLGTGTVANYNREFLPYPLAREFVQRLKLKTGAEWNSYCAGDMPWKGKRPDFIPSNPQITYIRKGWSHLGDWLGNGRKSNCGPGSRMWPYEAARRYIQSLGIKRQVDYYAWAQGKNPNLPPRPDYIPSQPQATYEKYDDWIDWGHWLGTGSKANHRKDFVSLSEANEFAVQLGLKNKLEWEAWIRGEFPDLPQKPHYIPSNPDRTYRNDGWLGFVDFLTILLNQKRKKVFYSGKEDLVSLKPRRKYPRRGGSEEKRKAYWAAKKRKRLGE